MSANKYEFIYHVKARSQLKAVESGLYNWYDFYLSPEELKGEFVCEKSIVFSLGMLLLNICAHKDKTRTIYRQDTYEVDWVKVKEKF